MGWFLGGYFCVWYVLFGVGYVGWLTTHPERLSVWMVLFGLFAYILLIPSLLFGLMEPVFDKLAAKSAAALEEAVERGVIGRGYAFAIGAVCSVAAMVNVVVAWWAAETSGGFSVETLGENGLAVAMVTLMMGTLAIIAGVPWFGMQLLVMRYCRKE
jgi:hypothetical protein